MKRIICMLMCAIMLIGTVACARSDSDQPTSDTTAAPQMTDSQTEPVETSVLDTLPTGAYDDYEYNFLTVAFNWCDYEQMTVEEVSGEPVNDALLKRNQIVSEKLGVVFGEKICTSQTEAQEILKKQVLTNDKTFDLYQTYASQGNSLALGGNLANLSDIVELDLSNPWWDQAYNETSRIRADGGLYVAYGDINVPFVGGTFVLGFNTQIVEDYNLESPYTHWNNGTWTWETMHQMCAQVNTDKNGDGNKTTLESDIFGLVGITNQISHFIMSSGVSLLTKDTSGTLCLNNENEKYYNVFTRFIDTFIDDTCCIFSETYPGYSIMQAQTTAATGLGAYVTIFNEGRALFLMSPTAGFKYSRSSPVEYGIVGLPKYDDAQEQYYNVVYNGVYGTAIPNSFTDDELERNGVILENLAAYSREHVVPAFVETTLYYKYAKDKTAVDVLSGILTGEKYCDLALAYNWAGVQSRIIMLATAHRTTIASTLKGIESKFNKEILATIGE